MNELMNVKQVAAALGAKESWVRSIISQRKIKVVKIGGLVRITRAALNEFIEQGTRPVGMN